MSPAARIESGAAWLFLVLTLVLPTIVGRTTTYLVLAVGIAALLAYAVSSRLREGYRDFAGRWWLTAFLLLVVLFAVTATGPGDMLRVFNFVMVPLGGAYLLMMMRQAGRIRPAAVALMAALGVALTVVMMTIIALRTNARPEGLNLGPIILPNATVALSAVAATGAVALKARWSLLLPLAIAGAVAVAFLTQSRGPLVEVVPLVLLTLVAVWRTRLGRRGWRFGAIAVALVVAGVGVAVLESNRAATLPGIFTRLLSGAGSGDETTDIRLALYRATFRAFLDAPWLGHGWAQMMRFPTPYVDPAFAEVVGGLHHLHNDILTFAIGSGLAGIAVYFVILLTPLVAAYLSPRDGLRGARLYGTAALAIVYGFAGLTDIALSQEFHRMMFVTLNAIVLGLFRDTDPAAATR